MVSDINQKGRSGDADVQREFLWPCLPRGALFIIPSFELHKLEKVFSHHPYPGFKSSLILPPAHGWSLQSQPRSHVMTENGSWIRDGTCKSLCSCSFLARISLSIHTSTQPLGPWWKKGTKEVQSRRDKLKRTWSGKARGELGCSVFPLGSGNVGRSCMYYLQTY